MPFFLLFILSTHDWSDWFREPGLVLNCPYRSSTRGRVNVKTVQRRDSPLPTYPPSIHIKRFRVCPICDSVPWKLVSSTLLINSPIRSFSCDATVYVTLPMKRELVDEQNTNWCFASEKFLFFWPNVQQKPFLRPSRPPEGSTAPFGQNQFKIPADWSITGKAGSWRPAPRMMWNEKGESTGRWDGQKMRKPLQSPVWMKWSWSCEAERSWATDSCEFSLRSLVVRDLQDVFPLFLGWVDDSPVIIMFVFFDKDVSLPHGPTSELWCWEIWRLPELFYSNMVGGRQDIKTKTAVDCHLKRSLTFTLFESFTTVMMMIMRRRRRRKCRVSFYLHCFLLRRVIQSVKLYLYCCYL